MPELIRLSVSIEKPLYDKMEKLAKAGEYSNRSEFFRQMIRDHLVGRQWKDNEEMLGAITLVYNHHLRKLSEKLTDMQHRCHEKILAVTHVHLDHDICAETIMMRGRAKEIERFADEFRQQKGVLNANLSMSTTGKKMP